MGQSGGAGSCLIQLWAGTGKGGRVVWPSGLDVDWVASQTGNFSAVHLFPIVFSVPVRGSQYYYYYCWTGTPHGQLPNFQHNTTQHDHLAPNWTDNDIRSTAFVVSLVDLFSLMLGGTINFQ